MALQIKSPAAQIKTVQYARAAATTTRLPFVINALTLIPLETADSGVQNTCVYEAEISGAPKTTSQAWAVGETLYFDPATGKFTNVAGALIACGRVLEAAGSADTTGGLIAFRGF